MAFEQKKPDIFGDDEIGSADASINDDNEDG